MARTLLLGSCSRDPAIAVVTSVSSAATAAAKLPPQALGVGARLSRVRVGEQFNSSRADGGDPRSAGRLCWIPLGPDT